MRRMNPYTDKQTNFRRRFALATLALAIAAAFEPSALANPAGPSVAAGKASFVTQANTLTVTNTPGTIINWQSFNIGQSETTRFVQQSAQSSILNRIGGQNASQILGSLQSNGRVFLVNPNGILFGQGAVIDVAGLVASSLNLSDASFLSNKFNFNGGGLGPVSNLGRITTPLGGSVYLIGSEVNNQGLITTPQGQVLLAAGNSVSLVDSAGPELSVTLSANRNRALNLGTISASGGRIDMFAALIEQAGVLSADSVSVDAAGNIILKATQSTTVSGEITATNDIGGGGKVQVLGDQIALAATAKIDVSGASAGGAVLIGGDYQGKNTSVQNATVTSIEAGAVIKADALEQGDGGRVIVWSNEKTYFDGLISARGGDLGGNGGFVETSGHSLKFTGRVDTHAPMGKWGNWLLDPDVVCFNNSGGACPVPAFGTASVASDTVIGATNVYTMLTTSNATIAATSLAYIDPTFILNGAGLPGGRTLSITAPHIGFFGQIDMTSAAGSTNAFLTATGTPTTPGALSSPASIGLLMIGGNARLKAGSGRLELKADTEIQFNGPPVSAVQIAMGTGDVEFRSPKVTFLSNAGNAPQITTKYLGIFTNKIGGTISPTATVTDLDITPYSSTASLYLGLANSDSRCTSGNLCLDQSGSGNISNISVSVGGLGLLSGNDLTVSSSWTVTGPGHVGIAAKNNLVLNAPLTVFSQGTTTYPALSMYAGNQFVNNSGANAITMHMPTVHWGLLAKNAASVQLNGLQAGSTNISLSTDPWNLISWSNGPRLTNTQNDFLDSGTVSQLKSMLSAANTIAYFGGQVVTDPCTVNPASCNTSTGQTTPAVVRNTDNQQVITPFSGSSTGNVTYDPALKPATSGGVLSTTTSPTAVGTGTSGALTVQGSVPQDTKAVTTVKPASNIVQARVEARAVEDRKTVGELKQEARQSMADASKAEAEAKTSTAEILKTENEARKAEAEVKKAENEAKKADRDAKQTEASIGQKAEAEAKQAEAEVKRAESELGNAKTSVTRASAETKKLNAEAKKAEAEAKKGDVESQKLSAESKKSELEAKKAEAEAKHTEVEVKKIELEAKQAVAEAKKAESEYKLALAEAREAKTPQQKVAAERRAEEKRVEVVQKKAGAEVKKESAEAHKATLEAKKAEAEAKKTEVESRKIEVDSKKSETDSKRNHAQAKKAEAESKIAEAESGKAKEAGKLADGKKADTKKLEADRKQLDSEKKANDKKADAESKKAEAEAKKVDAEKKKGDAEMKKAEAEKKLTERRERAVRAFAKAAVAASSPERLAQMIALRHEYKSETLKPALTILESNPKAADMPSCDSGGGSEACIPTRSQLAQQVAKTPAPRVPSVAFVPQIERKVAVIVAINNYSDKAIPPLESAVPDGEAVGTLMAERMGYEVRVIRDGTKAEIVRSINALASEVGSNDSVQVYYAGHGYQLPEKSGKPGEGYWIPADGSAKSPANWISNSDVSKLLANIPAKQVMLISDSCYSGTFAKEQKFTAPASSDPRQILSNRTVVVMSSGGEEPVSDEGKDGHSIFAWTLMNSLKNVDKFDSGGKLFEGIRKQVADEYPQMPQYGAATSAGHIQGGDYLFEARRY